jgi:hypothetical protein
MKARNAAKPRDEIGAAGDTLVDSFGSSHVSSHLQFASGLHQLLIANYYSLRKS